MEKKNEVEFKYRVIAFFILIIIGLVLYFVTTLGGEKTSSEKYEKPDDITLMSHAQVVLKDKLSNPKYSSYKGDYKFVGTGLRYKIEGTVNNEKFWMIIEFVDDTYKEYDLISLQVGNKKY